MIVLSFFWPKTMNLFVTIRFFKSLSGGPLSSAETATGGVLKRDFNVGVFL